jgi:thymidylate synthase
MTEIVLLDMSEYPQVLRRILQYGERRSPRGLRTLDLGFASIMIVQPQKALPLGIGRKLNPAIAAVEAVQLIAGVSDPQLVLRLAPQFQRYLDTAEDGSGDRTFWGAYGDRIKMQVHCAVQKLTTDPNTRQAVVTLWDPWLDNVQGKHDYPCTIALQFWLQDGLLCMNTIMRSNDAWLGLPYDMFQFTQLQASVAHALNTRPGSYRHTTLSLHLYETNFDEARALVQDYMPQVNRETFRDLWLPTEAIGHPGQSFNDIMRRARALMHNEELTGETPSESWYRDLLHPRTPHVG